MFRLASLLCHRRERCGGDGGSFAAGRVRECAVQRSSQTTQLFWPSQQEEVFRSTVSRRLVAVSLFTSAEATRAKKSLRKTSATGSHRVGDLKGTQSNAFVPPETLDGRTMALADGPR